MLDKLWKVWHWTFNPAQDEENLVDDAKRNTYKNLKYYTRPFEEVFENLDSWVIFKDMTEQESHIKKEIDLYSKYGFFNVAISNKILSQYKHFYFYEWYYYKKDELKLWLTRSTWKDNTFVKTYIEDAPPQVDNKKVLSISRTAIRKITWYSPYVVPKWASTWEAVYIEWQDVLLQDTSPIILVDWSRQIGKSLTIAEKAVELSFIPNEDTLVGWFIKKTTDVIRNYILKHIKSFPSWVFEHYKSEWYILNTKSWTRIYFRTLDNWAENVLWLTLRNIIVDEAQLIETSVFEDVLEPTLATTNGKMILIWTPWMVAKWYYYDLIMEARKWMDSSWLKIAVKVPTNEDISYYKIDYTQNPLLAPRLRKKIEANINKPSIQRQYCCNWSSWEDQLFTPEVINNYPILSKDWYFVVTFDPARSWTDRSAFCVLYIYNWTIYVLMSWFIPQAHKWKWSKQVKYYANWLMQTLKDFKNITYWVDLRWIWEWFCEAWVNYFKNPRPTLSLIRITYTTWDTENIKWLDWKVSKTRLISNWVDYIDEWKVKVLWVANKDLLEEFQFIYEAEDNRWFLAMKTTFKDDITNTFLTWMFIIHTRWFLKRSLPSLDEENNNQFDEWGKDFVSKKKIKRQKSVW